jgi:hypothetical protein
MTHYLNKSLLTELSSEIPGMKRYFTKQAFKDGFKILKAIGRFPDPLFQTVFKRARFNKGCRFYVLEDSPLSIMSLFLENQIWSQNNGNSSQNHSYNERSINEIYPYEF